MPGSDPRATLASCIGDLVLAAGDRLGDPFVAVRILEPLRALLVSGVTDALDASVLEVELRWLDDDRQAGEAAARAAGLPILPRGPDGTLSGPWLVPVPFAGGAVVRLSFASLMRLLDGRTVTSLAPSAPVRAQENAKEVEDETQL